MNAYDITRYDYRGLVELLEPIFQGETQAFTLSVIARDLSGNSGPSNSVKMIIGQFSAVVRCGCFSDDAYYEILF